MTYPMHNWAPYWLFTMVYACVPHFNLWRGYKHPCSFQLRIALNLKLTRHYMGIDLVPCVKSCTRAQHNCKIWGISGRLLITSLYCAKYWWSVYQMAAGQIAVHRTRRPPDSSREDRPGSKRRPGLSRFAVAQYFLGTTNTLRAHEMNLH